MYMIRALNAQGQAASTNIEDNYVTLLASMFRSVRFGATDSHGRANVVAFNFLQKAGAFTREPSGKYRVDMAKMRAAADSLAARIITIQGNGDYEGAGQLNAGSGRLGRSFRPISIDWGRSRYPLTSCTSREVERTEGFDQVHRSFLTDRESMTKCIDHC
jgi:hypothetical protein